MGLKVVLVTPGQPSVNPRIVKEADALSAAGHDVMVLYCFWIEWASKADDVLLKTRAWKYELIGGSKDKNKSALFFTKARFKIIKGLYKILGNKFTLAERTQARCYGELLSAAKKIKADWYIGHNLGALAVCCSAAKFHRAKCGFDFEDYHREESEPMSSTDYNRVVFLEKKYVPLLNYISASSPLILKKLQENFPAFKGPMMMVMNCFPLSQQPAFKIRPYSDSKLQLFWFSQTVGKDRGLEIVFEALDKLNDPDIHLTLAGRVNDDIYNFIINNKAKNNIHFAGIIEPEALPAFAGNFDIGLAVELPKPANHNICLANKIFTYLLAGNAIILSDTTMQKAFNIDYKVGAVFSSGDVEELIKKIIFYKNKKSLDEQRNYNYGLASQVLNWEVESKKLLSLVN